MKKNENYMSMSLDGVSLISVMTLGIALLLKSGLMSKPLCLLGGKSFKASIEVGN